MHLSTLIMIQKFGQSTFNKTSSDLWLPTMSGQQVPRRLLIAFALFILPEQKNTHATISNLFESKNKWVSAGQLSSSLKSKGGRKPNLAKG
jgi:hypothetical protein